MQQEALGNAPFAFINFRLHGFGATKIRFSVRKAKSQGALL